MNDARSNPDRREKTYVCECGFSSDTAEAMLVHSCDPYEKQLILEPLVRLSDVVELLRELKQDYEYQHPNGSLDAAFEELLEEITQNGDTQSN